MTTGGEWPNEVPRLPEEEIQRLAWGLRENRVFGSWMVSETEIAEVFLPLALGALDKANGQATQSFLDSIGVYYEWFDRAERDQTAKHPIFLTVRILHRKDWTEVQARLA